MPKRICLTNLMTGMTDQSEAIDDVYLDFSKAFDSVSHRLLVKRIEAMGIHLKEEFLKHRTLRVKLGGHISSEGIVKSGVSQGSALGPLLFLIFINDLTDELTCNHLFFADDLKPISSRRQQRELRSSLQQAIS